MLGHSMDTLCLWEFPCKMKQQLGGSRGDAPPKIFWLVLRLFQAILSPWFRSLITAKHTQHDFIRILRSLSFPAHQTWFWPQPSSWWYPDAPCAALLALTLQGVGGQSLFFPITNSYPPRKLQLFWSGMVWAPKLAILSGYSLAPCWEEGRGQWIMVRPV